jgi:hypothetical protein
MTGGVKVMNNKFSKRNARILVYGESYRYRVVECNNLEDVEEIITCCGKPNMYMKNFETWQEMARARKCYEWMMSALPKAKQDVEKPSPAEEKWFWQKQLNDEYFVKDVADITKWDDALPDSPNAYSLSKEKLKK